jgi:molecular chaperone DnaK (HSP70)
MKTKFIIGIDLGTTNSAIAFIRRPAEIDPGIYPTIELYEIPQLVAPSEGAPQRTLPSFLYLAGDYEISAESLWLPWDETARQAVGVFAREQGVLVPGRLVSSAKSWLCCEDVNRRAKILPWGSDLGAQACSPVEASAAYLIHMRDAWNFEFGEDPTNRFEDQEIVLTVPASFDEEARELTVEAAQQAGFKHLTLLEEPLAAFYSWIVTHREHCQQLVSDGDLILVCDVGGGTSDFSLVKVTRDSDEVGFERVAVGEHLLLGGDNVDHALTYQLETQLGRKLTLTQRATLLRQCCAAKEEILSENGPDSVTVRLMGGGGSVVGGLIQGTITRSQVLALLLEGFLPATAIDELPQTNRRTGLRELNLPYENDPAITRHLAAFLHRVGGKDGPLQPTAILFNGGFFKPSLLRVRLAEVITQWFEDRQPDWLPKLLSNEALDTAVAIGAAYYGYVRRQGGIRVGSGSPRAYYIEIQSETPLPSTQVRVVCVLPRATDEGETLPLQERLFELQANAPVNFALFSSLTRKGDKLGEIITLSREALHAHSPLVTVLRYGKKTNNVHIPVKLVTEFTEVGTLQIWCQSQISEHRWRLQFQLRGSTPQIKLASHTITPESEVTQVVDPAAIVAATATLDEVFAEARHNVDSAPVVAADAVTPVTVIAKLEEILHLGRDSWPLAAIRKMADHLVELTDGRRRSAKHEARWLNLYGFCLRPGFGDKLDEWRLQQTRRLYHTGMAFPDDEQCQAEWMVLWRRIAGGMTRGQQLDLFERTAPPLLGTKRRRGRLNPQVERESWRMLASLELLPAAKKIALGETLLQRITEGETEEYIFWALSRVGARIPFAATIDTVLSASVVAKWLNTLMNTPLPMNNAVVLAFVQLAAKTDDPTRDIEETLRARIVEAVERSKKQGHLVANLQVYTPLQRQDHARVFGESLPAGLRLVH